MSVDQLPPGRAPSAQRGTQFVRYDEYIDKQIDATRRMVKTVDVMTALLTMATGTLGFLLAAAIVEHWLVPGGFNLAVRLALFFVLCTGLLFFTTRRLWPLVAGSINPAYAAQAIEHDNPSLKNSLLNLLLFRQHRDDVTDAVYETLEEQAARRLTRVPVDSAVDRSQLLRLGYVLIAIVAAVALYKILSPKDPFVTAGRVLMPWARIVPASRVSIENVEPGAVTLARGEVLTVSADVRGIGDDDPVVVRYTTADGQAVDRPASMVPTSVGLRFTGQIPPASDGAKAGVAQNLRYRIEAGDARSLEYAVTVVSAPMITIERIDYDYPEYTRYADRSVERLGDIRAIEGTRVTIHARANGPIEEAAIDFEADGRRDVRLEATGSEARATFPLALRDDRQTPQFTSYVLRFTGTDGRPNRDPVKFPIDVAPDTAPEVSITAPAEKVRDVRLDETVAIEVDSIDSDFALSEVRLHGESAGRPVVNERLLAQEHTGRYRGRHLFTPNEHDLKPGDVVRYWVIARDNRTPDANEATSDSQTLRIVGADPRKPGKRPQDRNAQQEKREPQNENQSQEGEQQQGEGEQSDGEGSQGEQQGESAPGESASADGSSDQPSEQNSPDQSGENESGENKTSENNSGNQSGGEGEKSSGEQGESGESQQQQQPGGNSESGNSGEQNSGNPTAGEPGSDNQSGNNSGNPRDGQSPQDAQRQPGAGAKPQSGSESSGSDSSPVSPEGDNDGEAFERIQDFLKREGQLPKESDQQQGDSKPEQGESSQGESASGESASADGKNAPPSASDKPNQNGETSADENNATPSDSNPSDSKQDPNSQQDPNSKPEPGSDPNGSPDTKSSPGESPQESGESAKQAPSDEPQESNSPDGQHTSSEGESGTGEQPKEGQGSPESQPNSKPGDKWQQKPSGDQQGNEQGEKQEPPSGGQGKKKNDSQGDTGGDRSGGGEEGAGQKSERDGTGSAGQNQSADEGAGESSEQGAGNNSPDAGQDAKSNDPTGQSGSEEQGDGSAQREGQGEQPGGSEQKPSGEQSSGDNPQQSPDGEPASAGGNAGGKESEDAANSPDANKKQPQTPGTQSSGSNTADGAGKVPDGVMQPTKSDGTAPDADAANLEYARRQTDLVLETLSEQMKRQKVDKQLLDKLGWTEADLKRFVDRWQQLKAAAADNSPNANNSVADDAQRELDDALRSLGLRRGQLEQAKVSDDQRRDLSEGYRGAIPLEYQERLRAYNQGVSRARQSDE